MWLFPFTGQNKIEKEEMYRWEFWGEKIEIWKQN